MDKQPRQNTGNHHDPLAPEIDDANTLLEIVTTRAADFSRKAADDLYACLLEATQDYLIDNARFNIGERIAAAERQARHDRESWSKAEARATVLRDALVLILPLAKGFASANSVGSNAAYIAQAEAVVARTEGR